MKKTLLIIAWITTFFVCQAMLEQKGLTGQSKLNFAVETVPKQNEKLKFETLLLDNDKDLKRFAKKLKEDLEFSDQLSVGLKIINSKLSREQESLILEKYDAPLCAYLSKNGKRINVEVKNLVYNSIILKKEMEYKAEKIIYAVHKLCSELLPKLTGEKSICSHSLAYCKMLSPKHKVICVSDYLGKHPKTIIKSPKINVSPSWHTKAPVLYFSEILCNKVSLNSFNFSTKKESVVSSYDGVNMQISFSSNGKKAALCLSDMVNPLSQIYLYDYATCRKMKKRVFFKLTSNEGNNVSPCMLPDDSIIFCSDYRTRFPQIYQMEKESKRIRRLTKNGGYCAAPSYCEKNNSIVFTKLTNGIFQLFKLDLEKQTEEQLTFNQGNKHEPDFSPCGNFVVFSLDKVYKKGHTTQQIAVLNCKSGKIRTLTTGNEPKSFPRWSKIPILV